MESLDILAGLTDLLELKKGSDLFAELEKVQALYPLCKNFEREFPSLCFYIACVENAAFCAERILPLSGRISHVVHVRFGGGCGGGGKSTGIWLLNVLDRLYTDVLVTDNHYGRQRGDERIYELYPELSGPEAASAMHNIRVLPGEKWSNHGDITWKIRPCLNLKA